MLTSTLFSHCKLAHFGEAACWRDPHQQHLERPDTSAQYDFLEHACFEGEQCLWSQKQENGLSRSCNRCNGRKYSRIERKPAIKLQYLHTVSTFRRCTWASISPRWPTQTWSEGIRRSSWTSRWRNRSLTCSADSRTTRTTTGRNSSGAAIGAKMMAKMMVWHRKSEPLSRRRYSKQPASRWKSRTPCSISSLTRATCRTGSCKYKTTSAIRTPSRSTAPQTTTCNRSTTQISWSTSRMRVLEDMQIVRWLRTTPNHRDLSSKFKMTCTLTRDQISKLTVNQLVPLPWNRSPPLRGSLHSSRPI